MAHFGRKRGRLAARARALDHPVRLRILELFTRNPGRRLAADSLAADLEADFPELQIRKVAYHVAILKDAQLIPAK